jgi:hypothetical protein
MFDFYIDGNDYLPDFIAAVCIIAAVCVVFKYADFKKSDLTLAAAYFIMSCVNVWAEDVYNKSFYDYSITRNLYVLYFYLATIAISLAASVLIILINLKFSRFHKYIIEKHVKVVYDPIFKKLAGEQAVKIKKVTAHNSVITALSLLMFISKTIQIAFIPLFPEYWMIHCLIQIVWIINYMVFIMKLKDEVSSKYNPEV